MTTTRDINAHLFEAEFDWLFQVMEQRLQSYFHNQPFETTAPPPPMDANNAYHRIVREFELSADERMILLLAMAPHIRPQLLDVFFTRNKELQRGFAEFGGIQGKAHGGFLPTIETALFVLAGRDLKRRFEAMSCFDPDHTLFRFNILRLVELESDEPFTARRIDISEDFLSLSLFGKIRDPQFGPSFPAKKLETQMDWDELVLDPYTLDQLSELRSWMEHGPTLMKQWRLGRKLMPGYRCLFHGPPGTGKTLSAALLGKATERSVYRIDLSLIVSKYIGETEKNLERVFRQAENKDWILFFDEADALFGKRTQVSDSHDRFANQETSYLLQRVEAFDGMVVLSTNLKANIDDAFARRFQSVIHFPMPDKRLRKRLWKQSFSPVCRLAKDIDLGAIAERHELAGGAIMNVVRYASLMTVRRGATEITAEDLHEGIYREFTKQGRSVD